MLHFNYLFKFTKYLSVLSIIILLNSCGFKLRGDHNKLPLELKYLKVEYQGNINDPFYVQLREILSDLAVRFIGKEPVSNDLQFKILNIGIPVINESMHSYNSLNQNTVNQIIGTCNYKILNMDYEILLDKVITKSYTYYLDPNKLLANASEKQSITQQLNTDIIAELAYQLSFFKEL